MADRALPRIVLDVLPVSSPVERSGWYLGFGYSGRPMVLYAIAGQTQWRDCTRLVPITYYAGPLPEAKL